MIRFADYIEALDNDEILDIEAAERIVSIAQHWSDEEDKIVDFYLEKSASTLDVDALNQRIRRLTMAGEIMLEKASELKRLARPKLRLIANNAAKGAS